ncbi:DUF4244 domain-containing protein [Aeromicrobium duanguangcaii]|uniref:DUF4244 domain-containing protein n=1 Tax=Aeromicrobium duanguangcaii TaxID=2968086 RepID=A0ABY5KE32_9ACTN|nr:DUF4244 domain-containing protein [Aeromicrobium duanguangcaii]MCD9154212.1 DUF4244 domain-containing protein [Aeromicrobium duanguangcaii]MCL3837946.1 DUF4244 domain-containing protein [Aeromicrobium duanguangcaii]UUI68717.1 DUF4244 domain-containing protein [Aeromicrobium duanguangcaii]
MKMINALRAVAARADERGMSTSEYAVGTLGACTIGGVLVKIGQSDWFGDLLQDVIGKIPDLLPF